MKERLIAAAVVFGGLAALALAQHLKVDEKLLVVAAGVWAMAANHARSMFTSPAPKEENKP